MMSIKKFMISSVAAILIVTLAGCEQGRFTNQDAGVVIGGVAGGLLGNTIGGGSGRTVATVAGAALGAMIGGSVGRSMDSVDKMNVQSALETQPDSRPSTWVNPNNNVRYTVTPTKTTSAAGTYCRNYKMQAIIDGKSEFINGRACRNANGQWVNK
jgi:surface antigen